MFLFYFILSDFARLVTAASASPAVLSEMAACACGQNLTTATSDGSHCWKFCSATAFLVRAIIAGAPALPRPRQQCSALRSTKARARGERRGQDSHRTDGPVATANDCRWCVGACAGKRSHAWEGKSSDLAMSERVEGSSNGWLDTHS